jgi:hypothetical protein
VRVVQTLAQSALFVMFTIVAIYSLSRHQEAPLELINQIGQLIDKSGKNPHSVGMEAGISYPVIWKLYHAETLPRTTHISTLIAIARVLDVSVDDLYIVKQP